MDAAVLAEENDPEWIGAAPHADVRRTRPVLIEALETCASKRERRPPRKHGNIPL